LYGPWGWSGHLQWQKRKKKKKSEENNGPLVAPPPSSALSLNIFQPSISTTITSSSSTNSHSPTILSSFSNPKAEKQTQVAVPHSKEIKAHKERGSE
jgi:hypothetical protein